jgi:hypothetical protein
MKNPHAKLERTMDTFDYDSVGAVATPLPDWLSAAEPPAPTLSKAARALWPAQFESVFPRVMDMIAEGYDLTAAIAELPVEINIGAFRRWVRKDHERNEQMKEAEELRSESWADKAMKHALGFYELEDVNRSRLAVDTYKWRIQADNRRKYGQSTQIEITTQISVKDALMDANSRLEFIDINPAPSAIEYDNN